MDPPGGAPGGTAPTTYGHTLCRYLRNIFFIGNNNTNNHATEEGPAQLLRDD